MSPGLKNKSVYYVVIRPQTASVKQRYGKLCRSSSLFPHRRDRFRPTQGDWHISKWYKICYYLILQKFKWNVYDFCYFKNLKYFYLKSSCMQLLISLQFIKFNTQLVFIFLLLSYFFICFYNIILLNEEIFLKFTIYGMKICINISNVSVRFSVWSSARLSAL